MRIILLSLIFLNLLYAIDYKKKSNELYKELLEFDKQYKISTSKKWLELSGWEKDIIGYGPENQDIRGFASKEALNSPREDFISFAMEYINPSSSTIEDSIKCRTPNKYKFIKKLFKDFISPLEHKDIVCYTIDRGFLNDLIFIDPLSFTPINFGDINPDTVKGFELLYATPGTSDAAEIAGHLLLRIKLDNNPEAKKQGIENPNDIVVSFLADTKQKEKKKEQNKPKIKKECKKNWFNLVDSENYELISSIDQSLRGLFGGFLTVMDRQTLKQTIKNYTIEEDRNLLRFELILTEDQKKSLLNRLFNAKKNYKARYYFFDQNCASVLVKVIGEGIKVKEISEFSPIVSPPNTLVALFTRNGLAKPIYPSFYSYRKKAYMSQDLIKKFHKKLQDKYKNITFPKISKILSDKENERLEFVKNLELIYKREPLLADELWEMSNLIQEAEMVYEYKDMICENYTSKVSAETREFLKNLRKNIDRNKSIDLDKLTKSYYQSKEEKLYKEGEHHSQLLTFAIGLGSYNDEYITHIDTSFTKQNMGSFSNISMQRSSAVELGHFSINLSKENNLHSWQIKSLSIQKIQERLLYTPNYFSTAGSLGFGINVLNYKGNKEKNHFRGTLLGGELLFNLTSSQNYNSHLFLSTGLDLAQQKYKDKNNKGLMIPIYLQNTNSFFYNKLKWQNKLLYNSSLKSALHDELEFSSELRYKLPKFDEKLYLLKLRFDYDKSSYFPSFNRSLWFGLEVNNW